MQKIMIQNRLKAVFVLVFSLFSFYSFAVEFDRAAVSVDNIKLDVEYAHTFEQRATGLMYRESLCANCGMLFKYTKPRKASMWMKNTYIPLDVAFIDKQGKITDIRAMQPHDLTSIGSSTDVLYALEMNLGWFAKHNIKVGQSVEIQIP
ncbi:DUF192 domain-containing protein [Aliiglaciecola lipolytica]|uniref:DUF192 domain-containing protein n=1 Tax=Aliiglaciecola lipolytica E3 TaxID=1127673 RepID=K6Y913_9ALTE|nr:DUF192 domain-containing protein [Aliiglaciecola lipolytica]GAC13148.1 hypothetical protein GLIP_0502 [Aliiglaciecola lipolytica E3]